MGQVSREVGMSVTVDANKGRMHSPDASGRTVGWKERGAEKEVKYTTVLTFET